MCNVYCKKKESDQGERVKRGIACLQKFKIYIGIKSKNQSGACLCILAIMMLGFSGWLAYLIECNEIKKVHAVK